jgi:hypothetical protein
VAKENMKAIVCGNCNVLIPLLNNFPVQGVPTFEYHCTSCNGKVHLQLNKNPQGHVFAKQIRLTGSPDEFRPNAIRPHHQVQIPVAYTLGNKKQRATKHVPVAPIKAPRPAYTLGGAQQEAQLPPNHPMHPNQIRRRLQPIRWSG